MGNICNNDTISAFKLDWVGYTAIFPNRRACSLPTLNLRRRPRCRRVEMFDNSTW